MTSKKSIELDTETKTKRVRRRKRVFQDVGPLGGIDEIPGYRLYWALEGDARKPNRVQRLTHEDDYELVSPSELGLTDNQGNPLEGTSVTREDMGGRRFYLLKKPMEFHLEDTEEKVRRNMATVKGNAEKSETSTSADMEHLDGNLTIK